MLWHHHLVIVAHVLHRRLNFVFMAIHQFVSVRALLVHVRVEIESVVLMAALPLYVVLIQTFRAISNWIVLQLLAWLHLPHLVVGCLFIIRWILFLHLSHHASSLRSENFKFKLL